MERSGGYKIGEDPRRQKRTKSMTHPRRTGYSTDIAVKPVTLSSRMQPMTTIVRSGKRAPFMLKIASV